MQWVRTQTSEVQTTISAVCTWPGYLSSMCLGFLISKVRIRDFPGGTVVKNSPANAGDMGSIPGLGRSHIPRSN